MGKAIRTRRLSIISIISVALFLILAVGGIWSFRATDGWVFSNYRPLIVLDGGCIVYEQILTNGEYGPLVLHKLSEITPDNHHIARSLRGFSVKKIILGRIPGQVPAGSEVVDVEVPIWPWLLLLLIAPIRWLRAQPANTPGFPMITDEERRKL